MYVSMCIYFIIAGMGFKVGDEGKPAKHKSHGNKSRKDENNDEKDTMKQAPMKTYSRGSRVGKSDMKKYSSPKSKQLSMDKFATKLGSSSNTNKVFHLTLKGSNKQSRSSSPPKKFFTSSQPNKDLSDKVSGASDKGSELFESASDFEYDSEELANLESGDPEIIFNSPQKRRRESQLKSGTEDLDHPESSSDLEKVKRNMGDYSCSDKTEDDFFDRTLTNSPERMEKNNQQHKDFSHLFSVTEKRLGRTKNDGHNLYTDNQEPNVSGNKHSHSSSDEEGIKSGNDFSHLFSETEKQLKSRVDTDSDGQYSSGSRYNSKVKHRVVTCHKGKSSDNLSHLFKDTERQLHRDKSNVFSQSEEGESASQKSNYSSEVCDKDRTSSKLKPNVSQLFSQTEKCLGSRRTTRGVFSDSDESDKEETDNHKDVQVSTVITETQGNLKSQSSKGEKYKPKQQQQASKGRVKSKKHSKSSKLFEDSDHGSDTDDLSALQKSPVRMMKPGGLNSLVKPSASFGDKPLGGLLPEQFRRSGSVESNSSNGSGDRLKRSSSLLNRIQSMDVDKEGKKSKQPIVRRLLTSPKKVRVCVY